MNPLTPARELRRAAAEAFEARQRHLDALADALAALPAWRGPAAAAAMDQGRRERALLRMNTWDYIAACGDAHDLPIAYAPLLRPGARLRAADLDAAEAFLDTLRPRDEETEGWLLSLKHEARAAICRLRGDRLLAEVERRVTAYAERRLAAADRRAAGALPRVRVYAEVALLCRRLYLPWRVLATYRRFLAAFDSPDPAGDLVRRLDADFDAAPRGLFDAWSALAEAALPALELTNPADPAEIDTLRRLSMPLEAIAPGHVERPVVAVEDTPAAALRKGGKSLAAVLDAAAGDPRAGAVLAVWEGLARLGLGEWAALLVLLEGVAPGAPAPDAGAPDALGMVARALRGEARYRLGRYEDAYLDLLAAERLAGAAANNAAGAANGALTASERDALSRICQKAGNALLALGDEAKADEAFARARAYLPDAPAARAIDLLNRGNLLLLRNALDREQGYLTVDPELRLRLVTEGAGALIDARQRRFAESADAAEALFRGALAALGEAAAAGDGTRERGLAYLEALGRLNLGNAAWARGKAARAADGDGAADFAAAAEAYAAAWAAARGLAGDGRAVAAAALTNLTETRILLAAGDARRLRAAQAGARRALRAARRVGGNADLRWQAHLNLARILAGRDARAAGRHFRAAIALVEAQRAGVRRDAWQATLLRDKFEAYEGYLAFLYEEAGADRAERMFDVMERLRGRAFLDLLRRADARVALPEALAAAVDGLLGKVAAANEALRAATLADDEGAARRLARQQAAYGREWADLQAQMLAAQAADAQLNPPRITLAETQARLRGAPAGAGPGLLLMYQLGDEASHLLAVTADAARVFRLPPRRVIEPLALAVIFDCVFGDAKAAPRFGANNMALSRVLLGPVTFAAEGAERPLSPLWQNRVLVAADGILHYLPFEVLFPAETAVSATYAGYAGRYLLDVADVSYAPSASAWRELSDRAAGQAAAAAAASSLLAVYDVPYDTGDPPLWAYPILMKLDCVPGAKDVRQAVAFARAAWPDLPVAELRGRRDDDSPEDAAHLPTEANFLRVAAAAAARYVVFNGHAMYNDKHPSLSGLVFNLRKPANPDAAAIPADNFLRVDELFRLELPAARLTVLAACQTALGAPYRGEGLNALLRAFMYRGSPAVVATLWAVDAAAASWLVRRFFKLLAENPDASPARLFNQAKRAGIGFDNRWLPYQWAPFIWAGA